MDVETRRVLAELQRELSRLTRENDALRRGRRGPQLAHSSLEEGQALEVRSPDGTVRGRIGWQPDGSVAVVTEGGDPVSAPTAPTVVPSLGGLRVTWNGTLDGDATVPADFDHMAVHVSTTSGFTPSPDTYVGSIRRAGEGGMLPVIPLPYTTHYVVLVPVTTGGVQGTPSAEASATPLQVDAPDLTAGSVEAVHIKAGAVEADKLEAILTLATTIIAGIPGAARVELDQDGLRGYNTANEVVFAIDATGNAVFSGDITGSDISGSQITITSDTGSAGFIGEQSGVIQARVTSSGGPRAQLSASDTQAEYTAWADSTNPTVTPVGGMVARDNQVALTMQSVAGDGTQPWTEQNVFAGEARTRWSSGGESQVLIRALPGFASIYMGPSAATDPADAQEGGYLYTQRFTSDIAAMLAAGPAWRDNTGPEYQRQALTYWEGARPERAYTRITQHAREFRFSGEWDGADYDPTSAGVLDIADTHSILALRHAPVRSDLVTNPDLATTATFVDFTPAEFPPINFRTSWSGRTRITITAAGSNGNTGGSALDLGFTLSGGSSVPPARSRAWIAIGGTVSHSSRVLHLDLVGGADYTLTPAWRLSSGDSSTAAFIGAFENSIVVEPLM